MQGCSRVFNFIDASARRVDKSDMQAALVKNVSFNLSRTKNNWNMQFISKIERYMLGSYIKGAYLQVFYNDSV